MENKKRYVYEGPVYVYDTKVVEYWKGTTWAQSGPKAIANLKYRFRNSYIVSRTAPMSLPGTLTVVGG